MGTWGSGNFENDLASDYLWETCNPLMAQIRRTMGDTRLMEPDERDSIKALANMEILIRLADIYGFHYFMDTGNKKGVSEIAEWKTQYLEAWDGYIDGLKPSPDFKRERRLAILDTFDRFEQAVHKATKSPNVDE